MPIGCPELFDPVDLRRRLVAEALGTGLLLVAVVGSGTLGERLAQGNTGLALLANALASAAALFGSPVFALSGHVRSGAAQWLSECVFTFGLAGVVWVCSRLRPSSMAAVLGAYVGSGFWMTPTGFGNPAVALARAFTDSFSGIPLALGQCNWIDLVSALPWQRQRLLASPVTPVQVVRIRQPSRREQLLTPERDAQIRPATGSARA